MLCSSASSTVDRSRYLLVCGDALNVEDSLRRSGQQSMTTTCPAVVVEWTFISQEVLSPPSGGLSTPRSLGCFARTDCG